MLEDEKEKKKSNLPVIITCIVTAICFTIVGFTIRGLMVANSKQEVKEEVEEDKKEEETTTKSEIPYSDKLVYSTYGDVLNIYLLDDGYVYYKTSASRFAGINVCSTKEEYCKTNPTYNNDMNKIEGLENIKRLKYVSNLAASDESFVLYAIANDGDVYKVEGSKATKTDYTNVDDLTYVDYDESYYEFSTLDGKTLKQEVKGGGVVTKEKVEE